MGDDGQRVPGNRVQLGIQLGAVFTGQGHATTPTNIDMLADCIAESPGGTATFEGNLDPGLLLIGLGQLGHKGLFGDAATGPY